MHFVSSKDALLWNKRLILWILSTSISTKIGAQWKKIMKSRYTINVCLFGGINEHLSSDSLNSNLINWWIEPIWSAYIKYIDQLNVIHHFLRRLNDLNPYLKKNKTKTYHFYQPSHNNFQTLGLSWFLFFWKVHNLKSSSVANIIE